MTQYKAPALDKGLDILEYLSLKSIPQTQAEISIGLDRSPNEIYRMLARLEERNYISKSSSGQYSMTLKLYQLSHRHSPIDGLVKISKNHLDDLANKTKQSCHLGIIQSQDLMIVSQSKSPSPISISIEEGSLFPLLKTTSGKVFLAFSDSDKREHLLNNNTNFQEKNNKEKIIFLKELEEIKAQGYAVCKSQISIGLTDIAAPIIGIGDEILSVLAIASLTPVNDEKGITEFITKETLLAADKINSTLR